MRQGIHLLVKLYNQSRFSLLLIGIAFVLVGVYSISSNEEMSVTISARSEMGSETLIILGTILLLIRFTFFRYKKANDFSSIISPSNNLDFEVTNDVNENIRRHKEAQKIKVEKQRKSIF
jgi:hypothetical protein